MEYFIDVAVTEGSIYIFFPLKQVQLKNSYVDEGLRAIFRQWTIDNLVLYLNVFPSFSLYTVRDPTFHM